MVRFVPLAVAVWLFAAPAGAQPPIPPEVRQRQMQQVRDAQLRTAQAAYQQQASARAREATQRARTNYDTLFYLRILLFPAGLALCLHLSERWTFRGIDRVLLIVGVLGALVMFVLLAC